MTATISKTTSFNRIENGNLRVSIGSRMKLTEADRDALKTAYRNACEAEWAETVPTPSGRLNVSTAYSTPMLDRALGYNSFIFSQIVSSRDGIQLGIILKLQRVLGCEIINYSDLKKIFASYLSYIESNNQEPTQ